MGSTFGAVNGILFWSMIGLAMFRGSAWPLLLAIIPFVLLLSEAARGRRPGRRKPERLLIVGAGPLAQRIADEVIATPWRHHVLVGMLDEGEVPEKTIPMRLLRLVRPMTSLDAALGELRPERIVVALRERRGQLPLSGLLRAKAEGIAVDEGLEFWERLAGQVAIESIKPSALIFSKDFRKPGWTHTLSRATSILVSAFGLAVTLPLFALVAIAIKLDSRGPVFFVQPRLGLKARRFDLIKFRTMSVTGHTSEWAGDNLERITRVGYWLRKFRIDELPQFLNVLRGDMNLVGPRPHPVTNHALFLKNIPYYVLRCSIRPGITGWAQVRYGYADNLAEETVKMRYDLYYVKYRSVALDVAIVLSTFRAVLLGNPNYRATTVLSLPETQATLRHVPLNPTPAEGMVPVRAGH